MSESAVISTSVAALETFAGTDLEDLCDATEAAIGDGGGFGWVEAPPRHVLEAYWRGVLLVPERSLFVARLDGTICGSAQLARPPRNNEAQAFAAQMMSNFIAPWARGHGLARACAGGGGGGAPGRLRDPQPRCPRHANGRHPAL
jgi:hypothetical protein